MVAHALHIMEEYSFFASLMLINAVFFHILPSPGMVTRDRAFRPCRNRCVAASHE
jgi:hypothetical protein